MNAVIELRDVTREYGRPPTTALSSVSLRVERGEFVAIVGPSGSGKSTLLNVLGTLDRPTSGTVLVDGVDVADQNDRELSALRAHRIGFVFQDPASSFNPLLTIAECVAEPLIVHGRAKDARAARPRVDELLEAVQLPKSFADRYPHELSGGQRQRASLARSLALDPTGQPVVTVALCWLRDLTDASVTTLLDRCRRCHPHSAGSGCSTWGVPQPGSRPRPPHSRTVPSSTTC